jgi:hypothetical protein
LQLIEVLKGLGPATYETWAEACKLDSRERHNFSRDVIRFIERGLVVQAGKLYTPLDSTASSRLTSLQLSSTETTPTRLTSPHFTNNVSDEGGRRPAEGQKEQKNQKGQKAKTGKKGSLFQTWDDGVPLEEWDTDAEFIAWVRQRTIN